MSGDIDFAGLYPFLYAPRADGAESRAALRESVRLSTLAKCAEVLSLPLYPELPLEAVEEIAGEVRRFTESADR